MFLIASGVLPETTAEAANWLAGAIDWLGNLLDPVGEILGGLLPIVLAVIAVVASLRILRWLLLLWRGRTPRVQVSPFAWATSDDAHQEATWVTSLFREQLAALRLDALDPLPERAPGAPLVEIVEGVGQGVGRDIGNAAGRLFKAIWPDSAYEVWGSLRPHGESGGRISIQLIERRRGNRTLLNVALEEASWQDGARQAAMAVAGALYPRVRQSDRGPWTLWERSVPRELMSHYHSARHYEEENRLEYALAAYHAALDLDPLNPNLRLKIAMLQERLELDLDAWVTYEAIVDESDRRAWRGPNRRVYLLALYRLAVLLGNGRVAAQWVKGAGVATDQGSQRDKERHERREELLMSLERHPLFDRHRFRLSPHELPEQLTRTVSWLISSNRSSSRLLIPVLRRIDAEAGAGGDVLEPFDRISNDEQRREKRIEAVLQILGLRRLEELGTALRIGIPHRGNWKEAWLRRPSIPDMFRRPEFSLAVIKTSRLLVRTRIAASLEDRLERCPPESTAALNRKRWLEEIRTAHRRLTKRWPYPATAWRKPLRWIAPGRWLANKREDAWQLHYNAACANGSLLCDDSCLRRYQAETETKQGAPSDSKLNPLPMGIDEQSGPKGAEELEEHENAYVRTAIEELEEYAYRAGSDRVGSQADWVSIDDPDLVGLRKTPDFRLWASHHLPRSLHTAVPSRKADVKRFTIRVMQEGARIFAAAWRERAASSRPSAGEIVDWWRAEAEVWEALGNACREHLSWEERLKWLRTLQEWLRSTQRGEQIDFSHEMRGAAADSMSKGLFDELASLAGMETDGNGHQSGRGSDCVFVWVNERVGHVRKAHETGEEEASRRGSLREKAERAEALRAARVWTRLAEVLEMELSGSCQEDSYAQLRKRMDLIRQQVP